MLSLGAVGRADGVPEPKKQTVELFATDEAVEMLKKVPHVATISSARALDAETGETKHAFANVLFLASEIQAGKVDIDADFMATLVGNAMNAIEGFLGQKAFEFGLMVYLARRMKDAVTEEALKRGPTVPRGKDN